ncbi:MAG TPA: SDR family oxidoreductase [Acidimicrobiales bacterium]|nr:SDR family oxidoreductase [Acidimicrobiales bacterium]
MTTAFVTGANSGIGRAIALRLAADGHEVFGGMRSLDRGTKLANFASELGVEVTPVICDVTETSSVDAAIDRVVAEGGSIDILVNNAGIALNATTEDIDIEAGKAVFDANYWGIVRTCQAALPHMRAAGSGTIVNISSVTGHLAAIGQTVYASSKWAVECLSENLAQEVVPFGVRTLVIEPGVTRTAMLAKNTDNPSPTVYETEYRRMMQFYAAGIVANVGADVVADTVSEALADQTGQLRWPCAWGGDELIAGRDQISDAEWVAMGALEDDTEYYAAFKQHFGLDLDISVD